MFLGERLFATNKSEENKYSKKKKQSNEKNHNNKIINSTETEIYLFRACRWR